MNVFSHPVLYYKLPRGRKMSCFKPNENLAELIREIIQHREESQNDLDLNQTTVASLLWQASSVSFKIAITLLSYVMIFSSLF